ncbi:hypothetical protein B0J11DRAFT_154984 [Dendryphion nanum]|uniref:Uncharacterized protein n=1 Tax=Dendryphion nanum TaxID=256645 RepID=A0A9P9EC79_9PLEO|nr:hypothetical protein B0J11DRAFT_154984 [Dendryphion nanum]
MRDASQVRPSVTTIAVLISSTQMRAMTLDVRDCGFGRAVYWSKKKKKLRRIGWGEIAELESCDYQGLLSLIDLRHVLFQTLTYATAWCFAESAVGLEQGLRGYCVEFIGGLGCSRRGGNGMRTRRGWSLGKWWSGFRSSKCRHQMSSIMSGRKYRHGMRLSLRHHANLSKPKRASEMDQSLRVPHRIIESVSALTVEALLTSTRCSTPLCWTEDLLETRQCDCDHRADDCFVS